MKNIFNNLNVNHNVKESFSDDNLSNRYELIELLELNKNNTQSFDKRLTTDYFINHKLFTVNPKQLIPYMKFISENYIDAFNAMIQVLDNNSLHEISILLKDSNKLVLIEKELEFRNSIHYFKSLFFKIEVQKYSNFINIADLRNFYEYVGYSGIMRLDVLEALVSDISKINNDDFKNIAPYGLEYCNLLSLLFNKIEGSENTDYLSRIICPLKKILSKFDESTQLLWKHSIDLLLLRQSAKIGISESAVIHTSNTTEEEETPDEEVINSDEAVHKKAVSRFEDACLDLFMDDENDNIEMDMNSINTMIRMAHISESATSKILSATNSANKVTKNMAGSIKQSGVNAGRIVKGVKSIPKPFQDLVKNTFEKIKEMDSNSRREAIISGSFKGRLIRLIRLGIKLTAAGTSLSVAGPIIGSITILAGIALDSKLDMKHKLDLMNELEFEKKMVKEKLDDARSENDKQAKYDLMRIEAELDKNITRLRLTI